MTKNQKALYIRGIRFEWETITGVIQHPTLSPYVSVLVAPCEHQFAGQEGMFFFSCQIGSEKLGFFVLSLAFLPSPSVHQLGIVCIHTLLVIT